MFNLVLRQHHLESGYFPLIAFNELSRLIIAPSLYLSILYYISPDKAFRLTDTLHFIPFFLIFICASPFIISWGNDSFSYTHLIPTNIKQWLPSGILTFLIIQMLFYLVKSLVVLYKHQKSNKMINGDISNIDLSWLQYLLYTLSIMLILLYTGMFFYFRWLEIYRPIIYFIGILFTGYFVIAQREVYLFEIQEFKEIHELIMPAEGKTIAPRFTDEALTRLKDKLTQLMESEKLYLNNELNLPQLAYTMGVSTHDLSYVINSGLNMTFFKFINSYRINEAKKLLISEETAHLNILGVAYNSGFNSKSTFNSTFKKATGLSPSQFIKKSKAPIVSPSKKFDLRTRPNG